VNSKNALLAHHFSLFTFFMPITKTEVTKIAQLANLELTETEVDQFSEQLAAIVKHIDELNELDTLGVKPWQQRSAGAFMASYAVRDDVVEPSLGTEKALEQAPAQDAGHFLVPRVIGG
jgi:aspartyl-tRNA(Asn)/glutamyl-tRNA(Gln) amidotransferase subunit C